MRDSGALEEAPYHIGDYQSYFYQFSANYTVPENKGGIARVGFYNTQDNDGGDYWMYGLFPTDVVNTPYLTAGKQFKVSICTLGGTCQILSPVEGDFQVIASDQAITGRWKFIQHQTGYHRAGGGIGGADDTFAWDMNLNISNQPDTDYGRPVYAVSPGTVTEQYCGSTNAGGNAGQILISHDNDTWFSGYLHLENIAVSTGDTVDQNTVIGYIGNTGTDNNHLHFVVYTGNNVASGLNSFDADFIERERDDDRHHH